jgi:hypothetical protein
MLGNITALIVKMAESADEGDRDDLVAHAGLFISDVQWICALMGREQTIRSALLPGDKLMIMKPGGKATAGRVAE